MPLCLNSVVKAAVVAPWHSVEFRDWAQVPVVYSAWCAITGIRLLMQNLATPPFSFHAQPSNCPTRTIKPPRIRLVSHCHLASSAFCLLLPPIPNTLLAVRRLRPCRSPLLQPSSPVGIVCVSLEIAPVSQPTPPLSRPLSKWSKFSCHMRSRPDHRICPPLSCFPDTVVPAAEPVLVPCARVRPL